MKRAVPYPRFALRKPCLSPGGVFARGAMLSKAVASGLVVSGIRGGGRGFGRGGPAAFPYSASHPPRESITRFGPTGSLEILAGRCKPHGGACGGRSTTLVLSSWQISTFPRRRRAIAVVSGNHEVQNRDSTKSRGRRPAEVSRSSSACTRLCSRDWTNGLLSRSNDFSRPEAVSRLVVLGLNAKGFK